MGLDTVQLIVAIEERFDINIEDEEAAKLETVGDLIECTWQNVRSVRSARFGTSLTLTRNVLATEVREIIQSISGVSLDLILDDAHLVYDLGLD